MEVQHPSYKTPMAQGSRSPSPVTTLGAGSEDETDPDSLKITPLPKLQLFIAIFIQIAEPVTCTVIYPVVNDLVRSLGITGGDETKTGYYVGLVESVFYAAECLTVMHWGKLSDVVGRKPVLLGGMAGLAGAMVGFGLSTKYWMLLVSRALQGAFNGNVGVTKSVMAEITDSTNAPQAFAFLPVAWSIGSTLGPAIGGAFSNPADTWPGLFGRIELFRAHPYFLPCLVAALVPIFAFLLGLVALKETAPCVIVRRRRQQLLHDRTARANLEETESLLCPSPASSSNYGTLTASTLTGAKDYLARQRSVDSISDTTETEADSSEPKPSSPSFRSVFIPQVLIPITNFAFLAFLDQCVLVLFPLAYSTPLEFGGLGMTPSTIGGILGGWGVLNGIFQVFCFAWVRRQLGHRLTYMFGIGGLGLVFAMFPVIGALARVSGGETGSPAVILAIAFQLACYSLSYMSYACMFLYIAAAAPTRSSLGTTNGLAQLTASGVRALAPTASSSLFSLSLSLGMRGGWIGCCGRMLVYIILNVITVVSLVWSTRLPKELQRRKD